MRALCLTRTATVKRVVADDDLMLILQLLLLVAKQWHRLESRRETRRAWILPLLSNAIDVRLAFRHEIVTAFNLDNPLGDGPAACTCSTRVRTPTGNHERDVRIRHL